ncbi:PCDHB2 isoform 2 [Pongo abelii]|uniref:PCDHB2 isoform 2 n=1 Tax=Pongo abelii TaxID=9601 RepID=A0A2J8VP81_PONAB|nr:PCDHB2 isoform 2 [Pongo abelii]
MEAGEGKERVPKQRTCPGLGCRNQQSPKLHNQSQFPLPS